MGEVSLSLPPIKRLREPAGRSRQTFSRPEVPSGKAKVRALVEMLGATMVAGVYGRDCLGRLFNGNVAIFSRDVPSYSGFELPIWSGLVCSVAQCNGFDDCAECRQQGLWGSISTWINFAITCHPTI
jgi:hypothetical protein